MSSIDRLFGAGLLRMDRRRRRPEPAAIDITWVSCRGVRSSLPFHRPCFYASVCLTPSPAGKSASCRRLHRVKTPTDRAGGENPEWDERLRLYVSSSPASPQEQQHKKVVDDHQGVGGLVVRFELKAEVAVLGDVLAASAVVPLSDLAADGRTRRVSYQLSSADGGRQRNGVISFSYAFFHDTSTSRVDQEECFSSSCCCEGEPVTPPSPTPILPSSPGMYPVIDWQLTEQLAVCPTPAVTAHSVSVACSRSIYYSPPPPPVDHSRAEPVAVYPPLLPEASARGIYPSMVEEPASGLYPAVDLAPLSCYPPTNAAPCYGGEFGYPAEPEWDGRCLYG